MPYDMIKIVPPGSQDFGMPALSLVPFLTKGAVDSDWMRKRASALSLKLASLIPEPGHHYIQLISLGAAERYGSNKNGDFFHSKRGHYACPYPGRGWPESVYLDSGLEENHHSFLTDAHVYDNHANSDPAKAIGKIAAEDYNHDMQRGELIIAVKENVANWRDRLEKIARGAMTGFSMAFREPFDHCSACLNKARHRGEYCDHLKNQMCQVTKEGHVIGALNSRGKFFDISDVADRPADRIAWALELRKSASHGAMPGSVTGAVVGGAELAEMMGVRGTRIPDVRKLALARKLADIEKRVDLTPADLSGLSMSHFPAGPIADLRSAGTPAAMGALADRGILLSLPDFVRTVGGDQAAASQEVKEAEALLPRLFSSMSDADLRDVCGEHGYDAAPLLAPASAKAAAAGLHCGYSLHADAANMRTISAVLSGRKPLMKAASEAKAVSRGAEGLAKEYAAYQISFASACPDPFSHVLTVLSNRVQR